MTGPATCSAPECGAQIIFARTSSGAETPFDQEPSPDGTWLLTKSRTTGEVSASYAGRPGSEKPQRQAAEAEGRNFYRSHFATCPAAKTFRRADHANEQEVESSDASPSSLSSESG